MTYAICCVAVAPIRITADHKGEMVSQMLFGEYCNIIENNKSGWIKIICKADGYLGWCQLSHMEEIGSLQYNESENTLAADWINEINYNGQRMHIPLGSLIANQNSGYEYLGKIWNTADTKRDAQTVKEIAFKFLNSTYLWGGRSVFGIDCSGFSQAVYKFFNIQLLRDAQQQAKQGELVSFLQEARCGDLAFFDNEEGQIIHVGIVLGNNEIIHASGKVRFDKLDTQGIINTETGERTQKLRIIKRYF